MSTTVTFDGAPPPGTINFGLGQPSADLLPLAALRKASAAFYDDAEVLELNYGVLQGDERFLHSLAGFLTLGYKSSVDAGSLFVSAGNSQALDFVCNVFAETGDTIFVEEPSYFLAFQIFRDRGLNIVSIATDNEGLDIEALQDALKKHTPAFIYTIPSYHNPCGHCLSAERRRDLLELSEKHGFLIVADEVYQLLSYDDSVPAPFGSMLEGDTVLSLGSFSKILAPAMRLGWIQTSAKLMDKLLASGFINSGGSINHYTSHIVRQMIDQGLQVEHLDFLRTTLGARCQAMQAALHTHFRDIAVWQQPTGGYFFWLQCHDGVDTSAIKVAAKNAQVGFQDGAVFSVAGRLRNCLRLSFAYYGEADIEQGIRRLRAVFPSA